MVAKFATNIEFRQEINKILRKGISEEFYEESYNSVTYIGVGEYIFCDKMPIKTETLLKGIEDEIHWRRSEGFYKKDSN